MLTKLFPYIYTYSINLQTMRRIFPFLIAVWICAFSGCGEKRPDGMPKLYPTVLLVKEGGTPLPDVFVTFYNEDGSLPRWNIGGVTDANGILKLNTYGKYSGVPEGKFKVVLSKLGEVPPAPEFGAYESADKYQEAVTQYERSLRDNPPKQLIPEEYTAVTSTPLIAEVPGKKTIEFDLKQ